MRLATGVMLTIVDDSSADDEIYSRPRSKADQTRTMVIPLAQLKASSRKGLPPSRIKKKKKKKEMGVAYLIVAVIIGVAYYLNVTKGLKVEGSKIWGETDKFPPRISINRPHQ